MRKTLILIVLDGWGINPEIKANAVKLAKTPFLNHLFEKYPNTALLTSGLSVGLPDGQMGNSEVGHLNLGAGRIVYQEFTRISKDIEDSGFLKNKVLNEAMDKALTNGAALHLIGLLSDGGVHSHQEHLYALLKMAKLRGVKKVFIHPILDGRDTPPSSGANYLAKLLEKTEEMGIGEIATICGRYYAMDRDKRWERVEKAFHAMTIGEGERFKNPSEAVKRSYEENITDEFVLPSVITDTFEKPVGTVNDGDSIIFFNFRADRAREITKAFTECNFTDFKRKKSPKLSYYACMTEYDSTFNLPVIYTPLPLHNIIGEIFEKKGFSQLRIAETEKYAHVTFFFNGGVEKPFNGEERILIPSPKDVPTYDLKPQMSAFEVTDSLLKAIKTKEYDFILLNFANADMVGHTGVLDAAIKAVETVDACLKKIINEVLKKNGTALITADHGNAEQMWDNQTAEPHTAHTLFPVPFVLVDDKLKNISLKTGILADVAPTILKLLNIPVPSEMTGKTLF